MRFQTFSKGKVERPIRYIRENFFYGREFVSDADLNARALSWLEREANERVHGTLKEVPRVRFEREQQLLLPLAERPYAGVPPASSAPGEAVLPRVEVERRSLAAYGVVGEVGR